MPANPSKFLQLALIAHPLPRRPLQLRFQLALRLPLRPDSTHQAAFGEIDAHRPPLRPLPHLRESVGSVFYRPPTQSQPLWHIRVPHRKSRARARACRSPSMTSRESPGVQWQNPHPHQLSLQPPIYWNQPLHHLLRDASISQRL